MTIKHTLVLYIIMSFFFISCKPDYGTVSGNIYWKYNEYIGDKPDAGSEIYLYPYKKNSEPIKATADVQGNFKFEHIETGEYLLLIKSENTTNSPEDHLTMLRENSSHIKNVFDFDFSNFQVEKQNEFFSKKKILSHELESDVLPDFDHLKLTRRKEDTVRNIAENIINDIPTETNMKFGMLTAYGKKIEMRKILVKKDQPVNEVINFGITYM